MLEGLSPQRRDHLLRRYTRLWGAEPEDVAQLIEQRAERPCHLPEYRPSTWVARLGDDGRYHLNRDTQLACATSRVRGARDQYRHRTKCWWWYDDNGHRRFAASHPPAADFHEITATWTANLLDECQIPAAVAPHQRCPAGRGWPPYAGSKTPITRVRARLIEILGPDCATCGHLGQHVDHDHESGLVRGLLCECCNNQVDLCPHPTGCVFADYLRYPPAEHLAIRYPNRGRARPRPMPSADERRTRRAELASLHAQTQG